LQVRHELWGEFIELEPASTSNDSQFSLGLDAYNSRLVHIESHSLSKLSSNDVSNIRHLKNCIKMIQSDKCELLEIYRIEYTSGDSFKIYSEFGYGHLVELLDYMEHKKLCYENFNEELNMDLVKQCKILESMGYKNFNLNFENIWITNSGFKFRDLDEGFNSPDIVHSDSVDKAIEAIKEKINECSIVSKEELLAKFLYEKTYELFQKLGEETQIFLLEKAPEILDLAHIQESLEKKLLDCQDKEICVQQFYVNLQLALINDNLSKSEKSLTSLQRCEELLTKNFLGLNHFLIYSCIASSYYKQKEMEKAKLFYLQSIKSAKEMSLDLALNYHILGGIYFNQKNFIDAIDNWEKSIEIISKIDGQYHYIIGVCLNKIAKAYTKLNQDDKAIGVYLKLILLKRNLGDEYSDILYTVADLYKGQSKYDEALSYYKQYIQVKSESKSEEERLSLAKVYEDMAQICQNQNKFDEALGHYEKALKIQAAIYGDDDPYLAYYHDAIGDIFSQQEKYTLALESYQAGLQVRLPRAAEISADLEESYYNLGNTYHKLQDFKAAIDSYNKALQLAVITKGDEDPKLARYYERIAKVYSDQEEYELAISNYVKCVEVQGESDDSSTLQIALWYNEMAKLYTKQQKYQEAFLCYNKSLEKRIKVFGDDHPSLVSIYTYLGFANTNQGDFDRAKELYMKSLDILKKEHPSGHPNIVELENILKQMDTFSQKAI